MPLIPGATSQTLHWDDPEDMKILIETGLIWQCSNEAQRAAVDALVAGTYEMNDEIPQEIADFILKNRGS